MSSITVEEKTAEEELLILELALIESIDEPKTKIATAKPLQKTVWMPKQLKKGRNEPTDRELAINVINSCFKNGAILSEDPASRSTQQKILSQ